MQIGKIAGVVALIAVGVVVGQFVLKPTSAGVTAPTPDLSSSPACNSPELFKKFEELMEVNRSSNLTSLKDALKSEKTPKDIQRIQKTIDYVTKAVLHIQSTTTLGVQGTFMSCTMDYDHGDPENTETWQYLVGRNDAGEIIFNFSVLQNAQPPYIIL